MATNEFPNWLQNVLNELGWTQADLARKSDLATATISRIMSGYRRPDPESLLNIAMAFKMSPETVFRAAGLLPPKGEIAATMEEVNYKLGLLPPDQQQQVLEYVEFLLERGGRDATAPDTGQQLVPSRR